jgi:hypothetical protein
MTMKAILTIAGAALAVALVAAPAAAADDGAAPGKKTEKIIIIENGSHHAAGEGDGAGVHRFRVERLGDLDGRCAGSKDEVNEASPDGQQRTRILVCSNSQLSSAERAEKLEHVLSGLEARDDLNAEQKARVTAALRAAIARVRAGE